MVMPAPPLVGFQQGYDTAKIDIFCNISKYLERNYNSDTSHVKNVKK